MSHRPFAIVTGDFVPTGGMDRANYALASYLERVGNPVTLVAHRVAPDLIARPGVTFLRARKPLGSHFLGQWPLGWKGRSVAWGIARAGGRVVTNGGNCVVADINWVHYVHAAYRPEVVASLARRLKARVEWNLNLAAERAALRAARIVVCNSDLTRRHVTELCGVAPEQAVTLYYGTDPDRFLPATDAERFALRSPLGWSHTRPVVMFIGALSDRRKGFDTLFAAWTQLCRSPDWDAILVVVGSGSERLVWEARTAKLGLADRVRFLGFRTDVPDLLRAADALVAPTRYEAYGLGAHEALCCGLPVIVSAAAGVAERYPPELDELLLPDPDNPTDLAARLLRWRDNPRDWMARVRPMSEQLRAYTWDDMSRRILEVSA